MKTLIVLSAFPPHAYGGGEIAALSLGKQLAARGHDVGVITTAAKDEQEWRGRKVDGMQVWRLRFPRPYTYWNHTKASKWLKPLWYFQDHFDYRNRALMAAVLDEFKPDCVQVHVAAGIGYNSLREIGIRRIPTVYFMHDLSLVCVWGAMFKNGNICQKQCGKCRAVSGIRLRYVSSIPAVAYCSPSLGNLKKVISILPLSLLQGFQGSGRSRPDFQRLVTVIPNGVDTQKFKPDPAGGTRVRAEFGIPANSKLLLFVGRDFENKGLQYAVKALPHLDGDVRLLIVGPGDPAPYRSLIAGAQDRLIFAGPRRDMPAFYAASDALVLPTYYDTFPLVCMEAMASGIPVFATRVWGIEDCLEDGVNGHFIDRNGPAIAAKIAPVLKDETRLRALRDGALATAQSYDWSIIAARYEALLREISKYRPALPQGQEPEIDLSVAESQPTV